ncbi:unnamed protein product, partial [Amoebophrya sp. A120]|eukprot:GSA120T00013550001.1
MGTTIDKPWHDSRGPAFNCSHFYEQLTVRKMTATDSTVAEKFGSEMEKFIERYDSGNAVWTTSTTTTTTTTGFDFCRCLEIDAGTANATANFCANATTSSTSPSAVSASSPLTCFNCTDG